MLVQSDRAPVTGLELRSVALLAAVTLLTSCSTNTPSSQYSDQAGASRQTSGGVQLASTTAMLPATVDTCPDGLVLLVQNTANQRSPYKEIYHKKNNGCYVTDEENGQSTTSRAFFGAIHVLHEVKNPEVAEAGFGLVILNNAKQSKFTISSSRWGTQFYADINLEEKDNNPYIINGVEYESVNIECDTTVVGRQYFKSHLIFSKIPETNLIFLAEAIDDSGSMVWGAKKVLQILVKPSQPRSIRDPTL
jgi:hypothetical protein